MRFFLWHERALSALIVRARPKKLLLFEFRVNNLQLNILNTLLRGHIRLSPPKKWSKQYEESHKTIGPIYLSFVFIWKDNSCRDDDTFLSKDL